MAFLAFSILRTHVDVIVSLENTVQLLHDAIVALAVIINSAQNVVGVFTCKPIGGWRLVLQLPPFLVKSF